MAKLQGQGLVQASVTERWQYKAEKNPENQYFCINLKKNYIPSNYGETKLQLP